MGLRRVVGCSVVTSCLMAGCGVESEPVESAHQGLELDCPATVSVTASDFSIATTFDLSPLEEDCMADEPPSERGGPDPCIAHYAQEVREVASEMRGQDRMAATLVRRPTGVLRSCRYAAEPAVPGRVNVVEIQQDGARHYVSAHYTPVRPRTFGPVRIGAYASAVTSAGVVIAPQTPASVFHSTGPYSYTFITLGGARMTSGAGSTTASE
jgi:hypothetical protein